MRVIFVIASVAVLSGYTAAAPMPDDPLLAAWRAFAGTPESRQLIGWLECRAREIVAGIPCTSPLAVRMPSQGGSSLRTRVPEYYGRLGLFITVITRGKVRGCYGAFSHGTPDIETLLEDYLDGALTRDTRHRPLRPSELNSTRIVLTVTSGTWPVANIDEVDPLRQGLLVECGMEQTVYVPAELRTLEHVKRAILRDDCQVYAFHAVTIR